MSFTIQDLKDFFSTDAGDYVITVRELVTHDVEAYYDAAAKWREAGREGDPPALGDFKLPKPIVKEHLYGTDEYEPLDESIGFSELSELLDGRGSEITVKGIGTLEKIESYGGEGQGDQYWFILKVTYEEPNHNDFPSKITRHFKVDGYYASYSGGSYDEVYEVFPKKVMKTEWEQSA